MNFLQWLVELAKNITAFLGESEAAGILSIIANALGLLG